MKCLRSAAMALITFIAIHANAQSDYISLGNKQYDFLDRLQVKLRKDSVFNFSASKPYNRKVFTQEVENIYNQVKNGNAVIGLSKVDKYNMQRLLLDNAEWTSRFNPGKVTQGFYKIPGALYLYNGKDFTLIVNPVLSLQYGKQNNYNETLFENTRGILVRGNIAGKLGFYTYLTDTQERDPLYVQGFVNKFNAVPGGGFFKRLSVKNGYDYFTAKGAITFNAGKYFDFQFGHDRLFIGDGYRSLFLSDFSTDYLFLKINTRIWKLNYQNIFAQMVAPYDQQPHTLVPAKYMTAHYLSLQVNNWINFGVFENITFSRNNGFDLNYLNPVIFLKSIDNQLGAPDKANLGFDIKLNAFKNVQVYSQLLFNEFDSKQVLKKTGYWANKSAFQLGMKWIDAFSVKNLDMQLEGNMVRPFTYSSFDSTTSFTHYNQPLAHPLGANLKEAIVIIKYQPVPKLYFNAKMIYYMQGLDSAGLNFGSNPLLNYDTRPRNYGFYIGTGLKAECLFLSASLSYELFENTFIDANITNRNFTQQGQAGNNTLFYNVGIRMNIGRREFAF